MVDSTALPVDCFSRLAVFCAVVRTCSIRPWINP